MGGHECRTSQWTSDGDNLAKKRGEVHVDCRLTQLVAFESVTARR